MAINFQVLQDAPRLLLQAKLKPLQGHRFQTTGFADLGPARYTLPDGTEMLLVESVQSVANRMELSCWSQKDDDLIKELNGLPYIRVTKQDDSKLTNSILEAHRINSPYILEGDDTSLIDKLKTETDSMMKGPVNIRKLAKLILKYDPNALIHGVFLAKSELAGGRLRLPRLLSGFIEASDIRTAESGGVKNDRVDPTGDTKKGFGNVPFHRTEFVAKEIISYFNLDLAQIRGYGLEECASNLIIALSLLKIRRFLSTGLRLRTACDLEMDGELVIKKPKEGFSMPEESDLLNECSAFIGICKEKSCFVEPAITEIKWIPHNRLIEIILPDTVPMPEIPPDLKNDIEIKKGTGKKPPLLKFKSVPTPVISEKVKSLFGDSEEAKKAIEKALSEQISKSDDDSDISEENEDGGDDL
jgi:CRISPR-associated protein Csb1